jgi:2,5-diketo-D-gluconate reductase A
VNQIELHPRLQQAGLRREHEELGIATEAWSPLAQSQVLDDPTITGIAEAHDKTPGQVVIRWHLQLGNIVFPKSVTPSRIEENFDVFDFHLTDDEMEQIEDLDAGDRIGPDPDKFVRP